MSKTSFPPDFVKVLTPMRTVKKPRGMTMSSNAEPQRTVRISDAQTAVIDEAAERLGVTRSEFMRWVSYTTANELLRIYNETQKNQAAND